jgi:hypothetical protein
MFALFAAYEVGSKTACRAGKAAWLNAWFHTLEHILLRACLYSSAQGSGCCSMHLRQEEDESTVAFIKKKQSQR